MSPLPQILRPPKRVLDSVFRQYSNGRLEKYFGDFYINSGSQHNYDLSVAKLDLVPVKPSNLGNVLSFLQKKLRLDLCAPLSTESLMANFVMNTASGAPWSYLGYTKKEDCFCDRKFCGYLLSDSWMSDKQVWKVVPKREWYRLEDIKAGKVRTFIIPPVELQFWGALLYRSQNEKLKNFWWSAYGFNPYGGGVDRMVMRLGRKNRIYVFYDVKGWDRRLSIMREIYNLRNYGRETVKQYVVAAKKFIKSILLLRNGLLILKEIGNNSGSPNTTGDNILGHMVILLWTLSQYIFPDWTLDEIAEWIVAFLYGDDNLLSLPDEGQSEEELEEGFKKGFADFGLELDPFVATRNIEGCEFLGFKIAKYRTHYVPRYPVERLSVSFAHQKEKRCGIEKCMSKAWILTIMSFGSGQDVFFDFQSQYIAYLDGLPDSDYVRALRRLGAPSYSDVEAFYLGYEGGIKIKHYYEHCEAILEDSEESEEASKASHAETHGSLSTSSESSER